jgi:sugar lactone lactonase YvrE
VHAGWMCRNLTGSSQLFCANGLRHGPDGRLYVAEAFGSRISAIDLSDNSVSTVYPADGPIMAPDDLAFGSDGTLYVTDVMQGQVCSRAPNGEVRVLAADVPAANGITIHQDRLFVNECRDDGRLLEIFRNGDAPRTLATNLASPNAFAVGPDGYHYFPVITANEIWRVPLEGGRAERFMGDLGVPLAVKFTSRGELISVQAHTGEVLGFDIQSGSRRRLAALRPGLDNLEIDSDDRLFVSHFIDGSVAEIMPNGDERRLVGPGIGGPYGLGVSAQGTLYAADGIAIIAVTGEGACKRVGHIMDGEFPGWVTGLAAGFHGGLLVTTSAGSVISYNPLTHERIVHCEGLHEVVGVARGIGDVILAAESAEGRLLEIMGKNVKTRARGLARPTGVAVAPDGSCYVSEAGAGRVIQVGAHVAPFMTDLKEPHGIALAGEKLFVVDVGRRELIMASLSDGKPHTIASNLPVGAPRGTAPKVLTGFPRFFPGPLRPFAGLAVGPDGTVYVAANGCGAVMAFSPV